jgi:hypothetical protein
MLTMNISPTASREPDVLVETYGLRVPVVVNKPGILVEVRDYGAEVGDTAFRYDDGDLYCYRYFVESSDAKGE